MAGRRLTKLEMRVMDALWTHGPASVRQVQETFPEADRPAYTTVQTTMYRLEAKRAHERTSATARAAGAATRYPVMLLY